RSRTRHVPGVEMRELYPQQRRLQPVEALVDPDEHMLALASLAEVAQPASTLCDPWVIGADRPAITQCAEVLARVEAERSGCAKTARTASFEARSVRLCRVLEHRQAVPARERAYGRHVARLPVQVNRDDPRRPL